MRTYQTAFSFEEVLCDIKKKGQYLYIYYILIYKLRQVKGTFFCKANGVCSTKFPGTAVLSDHIVHFLPRK